MTALRSQRLRPRDNRRKIVTFVRLYQPQHGVKNNNICRDSSNAGEPIVNLRGGRTSFVKSVNTFHYYFHSCHKILFVVRGGALVRK